MCDCHQQNSPPWAPGLAAGVIQAHMTELCCELLYLSFQFHPCLRATVSSMGWLQASMKAREGGSDDEDEDEHHDNRSGGEESGGSKSASPRTRWGCLGVPFLG
jgi:hypothetical protein